LLKSITTASSTSPKGLPSPNQNSTVTRPGGGVGRGVVAVGAGADDDALLETGGLVGSGALVGATLDATELLTEDDAGGGGAGGLVGSGVGVVHAATNTSKTIKKINERFI
jgi:hypothetical protein